MVVKSQGMTEHCEVLGRVFHILRKHQLKLNPSKCSFGVRAGKFLGFMLTERGIEANPEKYRAVIDMRSPQSVKEVQQFMGKITALSRLISKAAETATPLFVTLKKGGKFTWTVECEEAFLHLKAMMATPPVLIHPRPVRTNLPIKQVLRKPDMAGKMVAWSVQLSEFDISFERRDGPPTDSKGEWYLSVDRLTNQSGSRAGVILEGPDGVLIEQSFHFDFRASNNQAEYEALLAGMRLARDLEARILIAKSDSKLVTGQVNNEYQTRDPQLAKYRERAAKLAADFEKFELIHMPRDQNERADLLANLASTQRRGQLRSVIHESLEASTIDREEIWNVEEKTTWMTLLIQFLQDGRISENDEEGRRVAKEAARYSLVGQQLYRRGFPFPILKCLNKDEAKYVMREVHEGVCGTYIGGRALASKIARAGYYWPTLKGDCMNYVKKCDK
ncbi:Tf2-6, partial [Mucuna pruriens]